MGKVNSALEMKKITEKFSNKGKIHQEVSYILDGVENLDKVERHKQLVHKYTFVIKVVNDITSRAKSAAMNGKYGLKLHFKTDVAWYKYGIHVDVSRELATLGYNVNYEVVNLELVKLDLSWYNVDEFHAQHARSMAQDILDSVNAANEVDRKTANNEAPVPNASIKLPSIEENKEPFTGEGFISREEIESIVKDQFKKKDEYAPTLRCRIPNQQDVPVSNEAVVNEALDKTAEEYAKLMEAAEDLEEGSPENSAEGFSKMLQAAEDFQRTLQAVDNNFPPASCIESNVEEEVKVQVDAEVLANHLTTIYKAIEDRKAYGEQYLFIRISLQITKENQALAKLIIETLRGSGYRAMSSDLASQGVTVSVVWD